MSAALLFNVVHDLPNMSSDSTRRSKRQRIDETVTVNGIDTEPTPAVTRSEYWLDDGNIVLQAENVQFRVHRSVLARQSNVFKDMFGMPQPLQPEEPTVDGCPIVWLSDAADDVKMMLAAFYDNYKYVQIDVHSSYTRLILLDRLQSTGINRLRGCSYRKIRCYD